jgi:hypothetical protein
MGDATKYGFESTTGLVIQQGFFEASEDQKHRIGICVMMTDGRCFHYARAGAAALSAGLLNKAVPTPAGHEDCDVAADVAIGDKSITVTPATAAVTKNQYAEGFVSVTSGVGLGQIRKIRTHPAAGIAANVTLTLYDPFTIAVPTGAFVDLITNPYDLVVENATLADRVSGVPLIDVPINYFFWNQTFGLANVLNEGGTAIGTLVVPSAADAGAVATAAAFTGPLVGWAELLMADTEHGLVNLTINT